MGHEAIQRRLEGPLLVAALLTIPVIVIEQSDAGAPWNTVATILNWAVWLAFLTEVVVMLRIVPDRRRWLREHPLDVAIVLFTPPFVPASLQAARAFRLLQLVRLLKLALLARRLLSTEGVRDAAVLALFSVLGGGAAYAAVESGHHGKDLGAWDGVWWALTTVTTVGYGDETPETTAGRIIAAVVMLVGIGFVAILTGAAAERFLRSTAAADRVATTERAPAPAEPEPEERLAEIRRQLDALERAL